MFPTTPYDLTPFQSTGTTEDEQNSDLAIYLMDLLEDCRDPARGIWQGDTPDRTLSNTCQAAEVLNQLGLGIVTERMVAPAADWLLSLPILRTLPADDHKRLRIFPSRFKTLGMLGRFDYSRLVSDFSELSAYLDEATGCMRDVPLDLKPELVTMIWLDALEQMRALGIDIAAWQSECERAIEQLKIAFEDWLASERARGAMTLSDEGHASYALDLLVRSAHLEIESRLARDACQRMLEAIRQRRSGGKRNSDAIYCGIQLSNHFGKNPGVRQAVGAFIHEVRERYANNEYAREQISFHALVLRLLASFQGARLSGDILEAHWALRRRTASKREMDERLQREKELSTLLQKTFQVEISKIDQLSGSRSHNQVFRVHFGFTTDATDPKGTPFSIPDDILHLIMKKGSLDSLTQAIERYRDLPEAIKPYFARHTSVLQSFQAEASQSWYLVMQDLAQMKPLRDVLQSLDVPNAGRREHEQIAPMVDSVKRALQAIHRTHQYVSGTGSQVERLYLVPINENLNELFQPYAFPALKPYIEGGFEANGRHYKKAGWYLQRLKGFENKLNPPRLGLIHGDCHSRNLMLATDPPSTKFVDVESLVKHEDYLADYAILLEDVAFYRLLPHRDPLARMSWDDVRTSRAGTEPTELENYLSYPVFPVNSETAIYFQSELVKSVGEFAYSIDDKFWKERLWFAIAKALILLARRQLISRALPLEHRGQPADFRTVLLAFAEAIRLLHELVNHLDPKIGEPLDDIPFPGRYRSPEERPRSAQNDRLIQEIKSLFAQLENVRQRHVDGAPAWIRYYAGATERPFAEFRTRQKKDKPIILILFAPHASFADPRHLISELTEDGQGVIINETMLTHTDAVSELIVNAYRRANDA